MKILRDRQVAELSAVLAESRRLLWESEMLIESKDKALQVAAKQIADLQVAILTEKRCHMTVAAAASQAISEGVDLREELDELAFALQAEVARLEEWCVSDDAGV